MMQGVMKKALAVLTPQQLAEWAKLTGPPFKDAFDFPPGPFPEGLSPDGRPPLGPPPGGFPPHGPSPDDPSPNGRPPHDPSRL